ncbi:hypothetical protein BD324DRAFT_622482 [Kockovaella imperatae]|uniref:Uncharacterized protein n=1 Tax=Kockovaella imperatae TaxID=4999 RepID=A0A1Y1UJD1_9TREE|nr:hypothetical protein BD324DRAFT_622482 [Kockovaella imperatae]ORX37576.1 hypothetical protein BD324DRAFT_622482 [Kockovaella imperatae]
MESMRNPYLVLLRSMFVCWGCNRTNCQEWRPPINSKSLITFAGIGGRIERHHRRSISQLPPSRDHHRGHH